MSEIEVFQFPATGDQVRTAVHSGEPWFVARDLPYQQYAHHFHVVASFFERADGRRETTYTTKVRATGVEFIRRKLGLGQGVLVTVDQAA